MSTLIKSICLAVYLLAFVGIFIELPFNIAMTAQYSAALLLGVHALEICLFFRSVKLYKGPLVISIALTLLFGFLHWIPLARENARGACQQGDPKVAPLRRSWNGSIGAVSDRAR